MSGMRLASGTLTVTIALLTAAGAPPTLGPSFAAPTRAASPASDACALPEGIGPSPSTGPGDRHVDGGTTTGWQRMDVPAAGFSIGVPPDWTALDMTRDDVAVMMEWLAESNPDLATMLEGFAADAAISLVAIAPISDDDLFTANINVTRHPSPGFSAPMLRGFIEASLKDVANARQLEAGEDRTVAGQPGYHLAYAISMAQPDGNSVVYCVDQLAAVTDASVWTVTYSDDVRAPSLVERIIGTLVVAPDAPQASPS